MTQAELARIAGVPQSTVARIERGTVGPRAATLIELLTATGHELAVEPTIGNGGEIEAIRDRLRHPIPLRTWQALGSPKARPRARGRRDPIRILRRLRRFGVRFVLIGELAERAHGVPGTIDMAIEVCPAPGPVNVDRLAQALVDLHARKGARAVAAAPTQRHLIDTRAGRLVLDPMPAPGDDHAILAGNARRTLVSTGLVVPLAALDDLIRIRRTRGTQADREALPTLHALRDELDRTNATPQGTGAA
jgi:transcriptional regulator with XRE-family HTH domain